MSRAAYLARLERERLTRVAAQAAAGRVAASAAPTSEAVEEAKDQPFERYHSLAHTH